MKAPDFAYVRAATLDDAMRLKAEHGDQAVWLAGGQSLLPSLAFRLSEPSTLIDISRLDVLRGISQVDAIVRIGAATTHSELAASEVIRHHAPLLTEAVAKIAHVAIRNRGTIGGSLALADPAAELPACCVALDATLIATGTSGERRIAAQDFFEGVYATSLRPGELLTAIECPVATTNQHQTLVEVTRRSGDYAMAGVAVVLRIDAGTIAHARIVYFAVGDRPMRSETAERLLIGHAVGDVHIDDVAAAALNDLDPAGDLNGGPAMKRHLAQVVLRRALTGLLNTTPRAAV